MHWPDNRIGVAGAEALAPALKEMTALKELNLSSEFVIGRVVVSERIQRYTDTTPRECLACVSVGVVQVSAGALLFVYCIQE